MAQFRTSRTFDAIFLVLIGVGLWQTYIHRIAVSDWVFSRTHTPSQLSLKLGQQANLTALGQRLLERGNPQLVKAPELTTICGEHRLGCLDEHGQIFILDDATNPDQATVTAAHEMLHLAYRRLSESDKAGLKSSIEAGIAAANIRGIESELESSADAADRLDEGHSLLGTEYPNLSAALERYYARYFSNRQAILGAAGRSQP